MGDHTDLPFKSEYAKSSRASCKACKGGITQGSLRLALMVQSPVFDGKIPNWFHYACFWKRARVADPSEIHGIDSLRWEDQEKIKEKVAAGGGEGKSGASGGGGGGGASKDYNTEYAKSGKSTCRGCDEKIAKDELRVSKKDFESQRSKMYGPQDLWHHVDCFVDKRDELDFSTSMSPKDCINGFAKLKKEDQDLLIEKLGKGESSKGKKRKGEDATDGSGKKKKVEETEEEKALKEQSKLLWKYRDALQKEVSNSALKILLELNNQGIPSGESKLLDCVADCMAFGALDKCPECKEGQLRYATDGYHCTGNMTEWTKCMYKTKSPKRKAFKVPKEYHDTQILKSYKYVKRERVFPAVTVRTTEGPVSSSMDSVDSAVNFHPLEGMKFVLSGKLKKSKADVTAAITRMGGTVVSKCDGKVAACISNKDEVTKVSKAIKEAEKADVHVVDEGFLDGVQKGGAALMITQHSIATWGSDVEKRIAKSAVSKSVGKSAAYSKKDEAYFTKNLPDKLKMTVKGGAAVDPDSGVADGAHVVEDRGAIYNAVLGLVDVVRGTNSYYKIQALEKDDSNVWWLFRSWGRVGTTVGGNKVERCGSRASVIDRFKTLYAEKTNNEWENRDNFKKFPNKFYPLDIDYGQDDEGDIKNLTTKGSKSKLPKSVQDVVCMIFDVESMKKAMMEFEIDLKKMPLGKLSKKQIQSAYSVLTELQKLVEDKGTATQVLDASNRFYTLIPHDFGMKKPPMLDTAEIIKNKTEMLDNLLEIEVAYSMLKGGDEGEDPIDAHYKKLKTEMVPMSKDSEEYKRLVTYTKNTHASTHRMYDLEVEEIFEIKREGEYKRYRPFQDLHNRQLLWHGSRVTNFGGILSQGLRIAPPEAPVTGYMFGKGVYFADMVSKSANYCRTSKQEPKGLMLLCEVALGNMYELTGSEYVQKLPKGKHSCKGVGRTCPNPSGTYKTPDGVEIPMGQGHDASIGYSSLLYNEYIVYDVAQISMKYLLQMNFKHKY